MVMIPYDVERGVRRLLTAPRDLPESISWQEPAIKKEQASNQHQQLFDEYVKSLNIAVKAAIEWWEGMIKARVVRGVVQEEAMNEVYMARLAGPAAKPEVVYVIRKYWLNCITINAELHDMQPVPPEVFLLSWLIDENQEILVQILAGMPYWPIGLDCDGNWS